MSAPQIAPPPLPAKRPLDVLGLVSVILAGVLLVPSLGVFLIGLIPEMNPIWWLGILLIPLLGFGGAVVILLAVIGIVIAAQRRSRFVLSVIGVVLGLLMLTPISALYFGWV
jgi:hypothetical protein